MKIWRDLVFWHQNHKHQPVHHRMCSKWQSTLAWLWTSERRVSPRSQSLFMGFLLHPKINVRKEKDVLFIIAGCADVTLCDHLKSHAQIYRFIDWLKWEEPSNWWGMIPCQGKKCICETSHDRRVSQNPHANALARQTVCKIQPYINAKKIQICFWFKI